MHELVQKFGLYIIVVAIVVLAGGGGWQAGHKDGYRSGFEDGVVSMTEVSNGASFPSPCTMCIQRCDNSLSYSTCVAECDVYCSD